MPPNPDFAALAARAEAGGDATLSDDLRRSGVRVIFDMTGRETPAQSFRRIAPRLRAMAAKDPADAQ